MSHPPFAVFAHQPPGFHRACLLSDWTSAQLPWARRLAALLLAQDGSATRLCEEVAAGPVGLTVHVQREVPADAAPALVRAQLPGEVFIERLVSLHAHGQIMMDNLSWLAPAALPPDIQAELAQGRTPIGHLLARMWIRRRTLAAPETLWPALWAHVGLPDPEATRSYAIDVPERGAAMVITECFRRGMFAAFPPEY
jgi:chorismate-pyruvate lyase